MSEFQNRAKGYSDPPPPTLGIAQSSPKFDPLSLYAHVNSLTALCERINAQESRLRGTVDALIGSVQQDACNAALGATPTSNAGIIGDVLMYVDSANRLLSALETQIERLQRVTS